MTPKLSLCIATMNRGDVIGQTLESIASQLPVPDELVIVDGSSDDSTERVVESYRGKLPALRYVRQKPAGVDRDYAAAVELSSGEYCWLFTDDDLLKPGSVLAVLKALADAPDCVIVNAEVRDTTMANLLEARRLAFNEDRSYRPDRFDDFARDTLAYLTFIGGVVVRRALWDARKKEPFFGTEFIHVGVLFSERPVRTLRVLAEPHISIRYGVGQWTRRAFRIWMVNWPMLVWSLGGISSAAKNAVTPEEPWRNFKELVLLRAKGALSFAQYKEHLAARPMPLPFRFQVILLCLTPKGVVNWLARQYLARRRPDAKALMLDLETAAASRKP